MKRLILIYKTPLLISLTLAVVFIALRLESNILEIIYLVMGALIGTFLLDAEYFIYSFVLEPTKPFSQNFANFIRSKDLPNALIYGYYNKADIEDKILNSALFQVVLSGLVVVAVSSKVSTIVVAFLLSGFVNSIYRLVELYYTGNVNDWFWALKNKPNKNQVLIYTGILVLIFSYALTLL